MKLFNFFKLIVVAVMLLTNFSTCVDNSVNSENNAPNIVIIYADDMGYGDAGAYGSKLIPTPNIDRLAEGGLRFIAGHCTASTCTPSRFSWLTEVYGFRYNANVLPPSTPLLIPVDMMIFPKMLKKAGYETGIVGKWHLGIGEKGVFANWNGDVKPGPIEVGFNSSFLLPSTNDRVPLARI